MTALSPSFLDALQADGPAADRAGKMDLYGWLVGSWDLDVTGFLEDGSQRRRPGEWHFGWVLEGRAIQDVWIVPPRGTRDHADAATSSHYYGTTLRVYDRRIDAWHIQWTDPASQTYVTMIGRKQGADIVQVGKDPGGRLIRWTFSEITPRSFRWRGEVSTDDGASWRLSVEFVAHRAAPASAATQETVTGAKRNVLQAADEAYTELRQSITGLDETQMTRAWLGSWGVREILVHASGWHREMIPALQRLALGQPAYPEGVSYDDAEDWNARFVEARRGVKLTEILDELEASHRDFMSVARRLPEAHFAAGAAAREIFEGTASGHYREHTAQIRAWRQTIGA
jgi:hypothetical protein